MNKVLTNKRAIALFIIPSLALFVMMAIVPIFLSMYYSMLDWRGMGSSGDAPFVWFQNYVELFTSRRVNFPLAIRNSFLFAAVSIFIQLPISLLLALVVSSGVKFENFYRCVYFIPVIISTVIVALLWGRIYETKNGLLNVVLRNIGLTDWERPWLGNRDTALFACFIPILWQYIGYHMLLMYGAIKSISPDIFEAACIDGASRVRTATTITIPLIRPMLKVSLTFSLIGSLKVFDLIYALTEGGPNGITHAPSTLMYMTILKNNRWGLGNGMAVFIVLECVVLSLLVQKVFKTEEYI